MNKYITFVLGLFIFAQCSTKAPKVMENKEIDYKGTKVLVGEIDENNFKTKNYSDWYQSNYEIYELNQKVIDSFKKDLKKYDIKVFLGTWCGDSRWHTPHFFKVLEAANYPKDKVKMFALDRSMKSINGEEEGLNITHVPTIILYKKGKEMGRIVESPINSLEEDIRDIVAGNPQKPNYAK